MSSSLYCTPDHLKGARKDRERDPLKAAWAALESPAPDPWTAAMLNAFRWRFAEDANAGAAALSALRLPIPPEERIPALLTQMHIAELLRDLNSPDWSIWAEGLTAQVAAAQAESPDAVDERLRLAHLTLVSGIVLERADWFEAGAEQFRGAIRDEVRPAGYLESAVANKDGHTFTRQFMATRALVLMAEAAAISGLDLWAYESRGISVSTAATYLIYYYYYPEKWKWEPLTADTSKPLYQTQGGFLEIIYRRNRHKDMKLMMDELRPVFDLSGGGLTTLSHAIGIRRGLFG
jgi:hypothetical protein